MSAPSAGALSAASKIVENMSRAWVINAHSRNLWMDAIADCIDSETASKELAEALRGIVGTPGVRRVSDDLHEQGLAAIAKYEARQ